MKRYIMLLILLIFVFISLPCFAMDMSFGVGKAGNTYDRVVGSQIGIQLRGGKINFKKVHFKGSNDIVSALCSGEIDAGVVQLNTLIGKEECGFQEVAKTHLEFVHILAAYNGKVDKVGDLLGKTLAVGPTGGGTKTVWRSWGELDSKYKEQVATQPTTGSIALSNLESGKIDAIMYVGGLRGKDMNRANKKKKTFRIVKVDDSQFNNLTVNGEKVYTFTNIDDDVYPNLIKGRSVKTLTVPAVVIVSNKWIEENEASGAFDLFYDAVSDSLPNIAKKLIND